MAAQQTEVLQNEVTDIGLLAALAAQVGGSGTATWRLYNNLYADPQRTVDQLEAMLAHVGPTQAQSSERLQRLFKTAQQARTQLEFAFDYLADDAFADHLVPGERDRQRVALGDTLIQLGSLVSLEGLTEAQLIALTRQKDVCELLPPTERAQSLHARICSGRYVKNVDKQIDMVQQDLEATEKRLPRLVQENESMKPHRQLVGRALERIIARARERNSGVAVLGIADVLAEKAGIWLDDPAGVRARAEDEALEAQAALAALKGRVIVDTSTWRRFCWPSYLDLKRHPQIHPN